jgi:hypothetical protein
MPSSSDSVASSTPSAVSAYSDMVEHLGYNLGLAFSHILSASQCATDEYNLRRALWFIEREKLRRDKTAAPRGQLAPFEAGFTINEITDVMSFNLGAAIENVWVAFVEGGMAVQELSTAAALVEREIKRRRSVAGAFGERKEPTSDSPIIAVAQVTPTAEKAGQGVLELGTLDVGQLSKAKLTKRRVTPIYRAACLSNAALARQAHAEKRRARWNQLLVDAQALGLEPNAAQILDPEQSYRRALLQVAVDKLKKKAERKALKLERREQAKRDFLTDPRYQQEAAANKALTSDAEQGQVVHDQVIITGEVATAA